MSGAATDSDVQALVTIGYLQADDLGNPKRVSRAILRFQRHAARAYRMPQPDVSRSCGSAAGRPTRCWTMRRARLALLALIGACSAPKAAPAPPQQTAQIERHLVQDAAAKSQGAAPVLALPDKEPRRIHIEAFDCEKDESSPGQPGPTGLVVNGIRIWRGGGLAGANWNADDLRCSVRVTTTCTRGQIDLLLRVGKAVVAQRKQEIAGAQADMSILVPYKTWKAHTDQPTKVLDTPYKTAVFRATAVLTCSQPIEVNPWKAWYPSVVDDNMFVAGFAYGE
jgi:hypothetical protein